MRVMILLIVIVALVVAVNAVQGKRTAIWPIKVWEHLVDTPEYQCWIWPLEGYTVGVPMFVDAVKHPNSHGWYNVRSAKCSGVALVGSGR